MKTIKNLWYLMSRSTTSIATSQPKKQAHRSSSACGSTDTIQPTAPASTTTPLHSGVRYVQHLMTKLAGWVSTLILSYRTSPQKATSTILYNTRHPERVPSRCIFNLCTIQMYLRDYQRLIRSKNRMLDMGHDAVATDMINDIDYHESVILAHCPRWQDYQVQDEPNDFMAVLASFNITLPQSREVPS